MLGSVSHIWTLTDELARGAAVVRKRIIPKNGWKRKTGALAGVALVTGIFVTGSTTQGPSMVPIAAHAQAASPIGQGYWTVTSSGKVYAYGDAQLYGDMAGRKPQRPDSWDNRDLGWQGVLAGWQRRGHFLIRERPFPWERR